MQTLWMGVRPGRDLTRLLVQDGPRPILKARLPDAPQHPRALETLAEGVLWYGRPCTLRSVWPPRTVCASHHAGTRPWTASPAPLVTIDLVMGWPPPAPGGGDGLSGLGDFADVRQLGDWEPRL